MSQENIEIVRAAIDAFNERDWDTALKDAAPDSEADLSRAFGPMHGVYKLDEVRKFIDDLVDSWESLRLEADEFIEADEHVVVPWTVHGRGRDGIEVSARVTWVWTIRDHAIERICMYQERQEALDAVGLSA
jgi:ketosteroid isomerase-like protein